MSTDMILTYCSIIIEIKGGDMSLKVPHTESSYAWAASVIDAGGKYYSLYGRADFPLTIKDHEKIKRDIEGVVRQTANAKNIKGAQITKLTFTRILNDANIK